MSNDKDTISISQRLRIDRVFNSNIFLLNICKKSFDYYINICGTTKNIYTVKIAHKGYNKGKIYCDCPDGRKFHYQKVFCKHSCFVMLKLLKQLNIRHRLFRELCNLLIFTDSQIELISNELDKFDIDNNNQQLVDLKLLEKFNTFTEPVFDIKDYDKTDTCLICFDEFNQTMVKQCPTCKKIFHDKCVKIWFRNTDKQSCPHCRSEIWSKLNSENGYDNLS